MCIIIDASRLGDFLNPDCSDSRPIRKWLERGGKIVYSTTGGFKREIGDNPKLREYRRSGKAIRVKTDDYESELRELENSSSRRSNDPHVLALAKWTGVRLLYTGDEKLKKDFKNPMILNKPRGKVYSSAKNSNLLTKSICRNPRI